MLASSLDKAELVTGVISSLILPLALKAHQDLLKLVASNLGIQAEVVRESSHSQQDIFVASGPSRVVLPLNEAIMDPVKVLWQTPTSLPSISIHMEWKYYVPAQGYGVLFSHPSLGSLVVSTANERECLGHLVAVPKGKDAKKLDLFRKKSLFYWCLKLRIANQQVMLSHYDFNMCTGLKICSFKKPDSSPCWQGPLYRQSLMQLIQQPDPWSRWRSLQLVFWSPPGGPANLPGPTFEGSLLFSEQTDAKFQGFKDSRVSLKSLGLYIPAPCRRHYRPQQSAWCFAP